MAEKPNSLSALLFAMEETGETEHFGVNSWENTSNTEDTVEEVMVH